MRSISVDEYKALKPKTKSSDKTKLQAAKLAQEVEINLIGLPVYEKEVRFHPVRKWRFDYAWTELKIALEIHGGVFTNGRHTRGKGFTEDKVKMNTAQLLGWIVIEATTKQVKDGQMLNWINKALELRGSNAPD